MAWEGYKAMPWPYYTWRTCDHEPRKFKGILKLHSLFLVDDGKI